LSVDQTQLLFVQTEWRQMVAVGSQLWKSGVMCVHRGAWWKKLAVVITLMAKLQACTFAAAHSMILGFSSPQNFISV
jgi:hypothetical protein